LIPFQLIDLSQLDVPKFLLHSGSKTHEIFIDGVTMPASLDTDDSSDFANMPSRDYIVDLDESPDREAWSGPADRHVIKKLSRGWCFVHIPTALVRGQCTLLSTYQWNLRGAPSAWELTICWRFWINGVRRNGTELLRTSTPRIEATAFFRIVVVRPIPQAYTTPMVRLFLSCAGFYHPITSQARTSAPARRIVATCFGQ